MRRRMELCYIKRLGLFEPDSLPRGTRILLASGTLSAYTSEKGRGPTDAISSDNTMPKLQPLDAIISSVRFPVIELLIGEKRRSKVNI